MALVLVLVLLPLLAIIMTELAFETAIGDRLARNALANQQFKGAILARVRQMRLRLVRDLKNDERNAQEGGAFDHYGDLWGPDSKGGSTAVTVTKGDPDKGDDITLYTEVTDEQSKFNLNLLWHKDPKRAARAFETFRTLLDLFRDSRFDDLGDNEYDLDATEAKEVAEAVRKFIRGEDRDQRVRKAELPAPAPDLRQGIYSVRDLIFSHRIFVEKRMFQRFTDVASGQVIPSFEEFVTIYGDGKINANTAPIQVLRAMFRDEQGQRDVAEAILSGRGGFLNTDEDQERQKEQEEERKQNEEEGITEPEDQAAFRSVNDISRVEGMSDGAFVRRNEIDVGRDFAVRSNFFTVVVTARRANFLRRQRVVFERHPAGCLTLATEVMAADLGDLPQGATSPGQPEP